jgi:uncharacterized protein YacL
MIESLQLLILLAIFFLILFDRSSKQSPKQKNSVIIDTSALIDGRIVDVAKSGFLQSSITVPKVVLNELQNLADGRDPFKRERARLGLDMVAELQSIKGLRVTIDNFMKNSSEKTDETLLMLAKKRRATLCTTDYNLNKVATSEGVRVINVNELAQIMRPTVLAGEQIQVKLIQKGEARGQGVGYLEDGTMVVVENTTPKMHNSTVNPTVEKMIQTKAGKMVFARLR